MITKYAALVSSTSGCDNYSVYI